MKIDCWTRAKPPLRGSVARPTVILVSFQAPRGGGFLYEKFPYYSSQSSRDKNHTSMPFKLSRINHGEMIGTLSRNFLDDMGVVVLRK